MKPQWTRSIRRHPAPKILLVDIALNFPSKVETWVVGNRGSFVIKISARMAWLEGGFRGKRTPQWLDPVAWKNSVYTIIHIIHYHALTYQILTVYCTTL